MLKTIKIMLFLKNKFKTIKIKKFLLFFVLFSFCFISVSQSQEPSPGGQILVVATVNIYNAKIESQNENQFKVSFDIYNRTGCQGGIKYGIQLVKRDPSYIVDFKLYDETLSLCEEETIHKEVEYVAPSFLKGEYELWVISRKENGLPLGQGLAGKVKLNGSGEYLLIDGASCYLTIKEDPKQKYDITYGVNIEPTETLLAHCRVKNNFNREIKAIPYFEIRERQEFGPVVLTQKGNEIIFSPQKEKEVVLEIPKPSKPQAFDAILIFKDESENQISNFSKFHFVLKGESATLSNLKLDKNFYRAGEEAKVELLWEGSADSFPLHMRGATTTLENLKLEFQISDSSGNPCSEPFSLNNLEKEKKMITFSVPITKDCENPKIVSAIKNKEGKILSKEEFSLKSPKIPEEKHLPETTKVQKKFPLIPVIISLIVIFFLAVLFYLLKKKKIILKIFLISFIFPFSFLYFSKIAKADTFYVVPPPTCNCYLDPYYGEWSCYCDWYYSQLGTAVYSVNLDKSQYLPGEKITVSGLAEVASVCHNGENHATLQANFQGTTYTILDCHLANSAGSCNGTAGFITFSAPSTPGNYPITFVGYAYYMSGSWDTCDTNTPCIISYAKAHGWGPGPAYTMYIKVVPCNCTSWQNIGCGQGGCASNQMYQTRTCTPSGCDIESRCVPDSSCTQPISSVDFTWLPKNPFAGEPVKFTDKSECRDSQGNIVSCDKVNAKWYWTFEDGNPTSSQSQNPRVVFQSSGEKTVTLTITLPDGTSKSSSKKIKILPRAVPTGFFFKNFLARLFSFLNF